MPSHDPEKRRLSAQKYRAANAAKLAENRKQRRAQGLDKHPSGTSKSHTQKYRNLFDRAAFVAWDGEGITLEDGRHIYTLLAWKAWNGESGKLENVTGLRTIDILDYIAQISLKFPHSIHVGFSLGYDINKILTDCSPEQIQGVKDSSRDTKYAPYIGNYQVVYRNRREFIMSWHPRDASNRWLFKIKQDGTKKYITHSFHLWDVFGFFQTSFVNTIEKWLGKDYPDLEMIREQKAQRGSFQAENAKTVETYCFAELDALLLIMTKFRDCCITMGLTLKRWDGAGAAAAAYLSQIKITEHITEQAADIEEATRYAYFGGRIELIQFGHHEGEIPHDDINSAYPTALQFCPSLYSGRLYKSSCALVSLGFQDFTLCHITWQATEEAPFYPFPYRAKDGTITYPSHGEGWYWAPEVCAARDNFRGVIELKESYAYKADGDIEFPLASAVQTLYRQRQQWVKEGNPAEKVAKLTLNSLYGKFAQKIASKDRETGTWKKPVFHCLAWAGFTTSYTRASIYRAAMTKPEAIIMFQTDGICATETLPIATSEVKELGLWEHDVYKWITCVQSGVYWYEKDEKVSEYVRGFDSDKEQSAIIAREHSIRQAWQTYTIREHATQNVSSYPLSETLSFIADSGDWGIYPWQLTRFVTMGSTVSRLADGTVKKHEKLWERWGTFYKAERDLRLGPDGTKRIIKPGTPLEPWRALVQTLARDDDVNGISYPYTRPWDIGADLLGIPEDADGVPMKIVLDEQEDTE